MAYFPLLSNVSNNVTVCIGNSDVEKSTRKVCEMLFRVYLFKSENLGDFGGKGGTNLVAACLMLPEQCPLKNAIKPFPKSWLGTTKQTWHDSIINTEYIQT